MIFPLSVKMATVKFHFSHDSIVNKTLANKLPAILTIEKLGIFYLEENGEYQPPECFLYILC